MSVPAVRFRHVAELGSTTLEVKVQDRHWQERTRQTNVVYVWGAINPLSPPVDFNDEAGWKIHNRAEVKAQRELLDMAFHLAGITYSKIHFSRTAGCACGCSPGFVVTAMDLPGKVSSYHADVFVTSTPLVPAPVDSPTELDQPVPAALEASAPALDRNTLAGLLG